MWISGYQSIRLPDIRGTGEQEFLPRFCTNYTNFLDADCADYAVFCHEKAQNAQKEQKNDQKSALSAHK